MSEIYNKDSVQSESQENPYLHLSRFAGQLPYSLKDKIISEMEKREVPSKLYNEAKNKMNEISKKHGVLLTKDNPYSDAMLTELDQVSKEHFNAVQKHYSGLSHSCPHNDPLYPVPIDSITQPDFWWTDWSAVWSRGADVKWRDSGLDFNFALDYNNGNLFPFSPLTLVNRYVIDPDRHPNFPWFTLLVSNPQINLSGAGSGWASLAYLRPFGGDNWSKTWLVLRQTIYQIVNGNKIILSDRYNDETRLVFIENTGYQNDFTLPGNTDMPSIVSTYIRGFPIWADLELRFDAQLEGRAWLSFSGRASMPQWRLGFVPIPF